MKRSDGVGAPSTARAALAGTIIAVVVVALLGTLVGGGGRDPMSGDQAVTFTERAFAEAGVDAVVGEPTAGTFGTGPPAREAWVVPAEVAGRQITLTVDADGDRALNLADGLEDGTNVLDDDQFDALAQFRFDPRQDDTTLVSVVALGAVLAAGLLLGRAVSSRQAAFPAL